MALVVPERSERPEEPEDAQDAKNTWAGGRSE